MDTGSEMLIEVLVEALPAPSFFSWLNYRPGYAARWMHVDYYDQLSLTPLRHSRPIRWRLRFWDATARPRRFFR